MNILDILLAVMSLALMIGAWKLISCIETVILKQYETGNKTLAINSVERMPQFTFVQILGEILIHGMFFWMTYKAGLVFFSAMVFAGLGLNFWVMFVQFRLAKQLSVKANEPQLSDQIVRAVDGYKALHG